jgi:hypothetical protein
MTRLIPDHLRLVALAALVACALPAAAQDSPWVLTTDYSLFGRVRQVGASEPWTVSGDLATVPGDAVGRHHQGLVYILGRGGSNLLQIYDPAAGFALVREFSLGEGRNPQDIAFAPDGTAYVSCYDEAVLLRVDTEAGTVLETFSTAAHADADGLPETAWMLEHEGRLYITCQLLDRNNWYAPVGPGKLLVFDLTSRQWLDPIILTGGDPYTRIVPYRDADGRDLLAVGCVGYYALLDGGVDLVDPVTGVSEGYLATEQQLGGDVLTFLVIGNHWLYALVSSPSFTTSLVRLDLWEGGASVLDASDAYTHADLAFDGDFQLFVADRTSGAAGVRVFDAASGAELTDSPLTTGLPPFLFIMPQPGSAAPVEQAPAAGLALGRAYPNPCNPRATVPVSGPAGQPVQVSVFDLRGRRVLVRQVTLDGQGRAAFEFTGETGGGRPLAAGIYRVVAQGQGSLAAGSVCLVK